VIRKSFLYFSDGIILICRYSESEKIDVVVVYRGTSENTNTKSNAYKYSTEDYLCNEHWRESTGTGIRPSVLTILIQTRQTLCVCKETLSLLTPWLMWSLNCALTFGDPDHQSLPSGLRYFWRLLKSSRTGQYVDRRPRHQKEQNFQWFTLRVIFDFVRIQSLDSLDWNLQQFVCTSIRLLRNWLTLTGITGTSYEDAEQFRRFAAIKKLTLTHI